MKTSLTLTHALILCVAAVLVLVIGIVGMSIIGALDRQAEQERFDRSWGNCTTLFDSYDERLDCHIRNVSD